MRFSLTLCLAIALAAVSGFPSATSCFAEASQDRSAQSAVADSLHRPPAWAVPIEKPGLPNLHKVTEDLYRGAQPTEEGMAALQAMGIRTVVNLRARHSDADEIGTLNLRRIEIPTDTWSLDEASVIRFLQIVTKTNSAPFFVHCQHGADRTGTMCAVYRIVIQGWTKGEAIREMTEGGYGFHEVWENLIDLIWGLDVDQLRVKAGVKAP